jgi:hypothetical protein
MCKPKNLRRLALNKRSGRPRLKACDAQNMGHNRPHAVGFPIRSYPLFRALHLRFSISVFDIILCLLIWENAIHALFA